MNEYPVAMLCHGDESYGIQRVVLDVMTSTPGARVLALREGRLTERARQLGMRVDVQPARRPFDPLRVRLAHLPRVLFHLRVNAAPLAKWCQAEGVRIVHTHLLSMSTLGGWVARRSNGAVKSVWHVHVIPGQGRLGWLTKRLHGLAGVLLAHRIISVSAAAARPYVGWGRDHVRIVYNGIPQPVTVDAARTASLREEFRRDIRIALCWAGRITHAKGLHVAVDALARLGRRDVGLIVLGDSPGREVRETEYMDRLHELVAQRGVERQVQFRGRVDDVSEHMAASDVVVHTRIDPEPCSMVIIEGLSVGRALIATRTGGTPELIRDGENGLLTEPNDPEDLARALDRVCSDPEYREALGVRAQQTAQKRFSLRRVATEVQAVYRELLES